MTEEQQAIISIETALNQGQVFQAHNLASETRLTFPDNLRISQLLVISLNRLGQPDKAIKIILENVKDGIQDGETMGLLGRTYKDLYKQTRNLDFLKKSANAYFQGYLYSKEYYPAINAAGLFLLLNKSSQATQIAKEVVAQIGTPQDYWSTSTMGEANLLLGQLDVAVSFFKQAINNNPKQFGKYQSTFGQLLFLSETIDIPEYILDLFPKPNIAVFSGHMVDQPDREDKRFPAEIENKVKAALKSKVELLDIDIGFTSSASGSDILFIEVLKEKDAEIKAYIPFRKEDFISTSVSFAGHGWIKRFENCYDCGPKYLTTEPYMDTPELFNHLGKVMMGESMILADHYKTKPIFISVLAPFQKRKLGGTNDLFNLWPYPDSHFNIDPTQFIKNKTEVPSIGKSKASLHAESSDFLREMSNILFADILGFSKMPAEDIPAVILKIFAEIKKRMKPFEHRIRVINTWGDAILICHPNTDTLMQIASVIQLVFNGADRIPDLPEGLNIRIALHAGPVFFANDPLTGNANAFGSTINRTARMEPVTLPGLIYASDQFAALLKLENHNNYNFQHVGIIELPKGFGKQEVYSVTEIL